MHPSVAAAVVHVIPSAAADLLRAPGVSVEPSQAQEDSGVVPRLLLGCVRLWAFGHDRLDATMRLRGEVATSARVAGRELPEDHEQHQTGRQPETGQDERA